MLLALVHAPPGPAQESLRAVGVTVGVVHRALEAITGPNSVLIPDIDPARVTAGDRTWKVLLGAAAMAEPAPVLPDPEGVGGPPPEDVHVLAALVAHDEPCVAMLLLHQLEVVAVLRGALGHLLDPTQAVHEKGE